jgi:sulfatase modifying factor 1
MSRGNRRWFFLGCGLILLVSCVDPDPPALYKSKTGLDFVLVQAGSFEMGRNINGDTKESVRKVTLTRSYYICKTEITFELFDQYWKETQAIAQWEKPDDFGYGRSKRPAIGVTWYDAAKFCNWLSQKEGLQPAYKIDVGGDRVVWSQSSNGYRLPSEAEWEYAAKGGPNSKGFLYAGSDDPDEVAWYGNNSGWETHPVGLKKPNELGLYDMSGNVGEYCWNWLEFFDNSKREEIDSKGPAGGEYKAVRGGAHMLNKQYLITAYRYFTLANRRSDADGLRVVRYVAPNG